MILSAPSLLPDFLIAAVVFAAHSWWQKQVHSTTAHGGKRISDEELQATMKIWQRFDTGASEDRLFVIGYLSSADPIRQTSGMDGLKCPH